METLTYKLEIKRSDDSIYWDMSYTTTNYEINAKINNI